MKSTRQKKKRKKHEKQIMALIYGAHAFASMRSTIIFQRTCLNYHQIAGWECAETRNGVFITKDNTTPSAVVEDTSGSSVLVAL